MEHTNAHPEFAVTSARGDRFYLEACVVTGESAAQAASRARKERVYDALDRMESPDFFVGMKVRGAPASDPSARHMRHFLRERLGTLDPGVMLKLLNARGLDGLPRWHYEHDGWKIDFFPWPKGSKTRGKPGVRPLGIQFEGWWDVRTADAIRSTLEDKGGKYGSLNVPYVIALNVLDQGWDHLDVAHALFGKQLPMNMVDLAKLSQDQTSSGAWVFGGQAKWTRVSAVLLLVWLRPWTIPRANVCLCHHPWAKLRFESELTRLPQFVRVDDKMEWRPGISLADIFGLSSEWPDA